MQNDQIKWLESQFESINNRFDKYDELVNKLFDGLKEVRIILERNTVTVEQHHSRSKTLERFQLKAQRRLELAEAEINEIKNSVNLITNNMKPIQSHVAEVSGWVHFFSGLPKVIKFFTLVFGLIIAYYGVVSIVKDSVTFMSK